MAVLWFVARVVVTIVLVGAAVVWCQEIAWPWIGRRLQGMKRRRSR